MSMMMLAFRLVCFGIPAASGALPSFSLDATAPFFEVWALEETPDGEGGNVASSQTLSFPLQQTKVEANVANGVVHAKVTQTYRNEGSHCLNSRYVFPLPSAAAISAMVMRIGDRTVEGQIRTRQQARDEFEQAKSKGQSASLLDQERPNVFSMELANILPNETTEVTVEYSETLVPIDGVFAFTFPVVVGPRYGEGWVPGSEPSNLLTDVQLTMSPPCLGLSSDLALTSSDTSDMTHAAASNCSSDIVIKFWFTEKAVGAQFLLSERDNEKYFSIAIQPPQRQLLDDSQILSREYMFILDVSGSMTGYPIDLSKKLMIKLLKENIRPRDRLNILLFAGGQAVLNDEGSVEATPEEVDRAIAWLERSMKAGGWTDLLPALKKAFGFKVFDQSMARTIIIMTDGYVTVEKEAFDVVRENLGQGNVFVFGIGSSVNRYLIEGLARVGYGSPFVVSKESEGDEVVKKLQKYIDTPVLTSLRLSFEGQFKAYDLEPPYLPDVFASRPIQVVGKWEGQLDGHVRLAGLLAGGSAWSFEADLAAVRMTTHPTVPLLWARSRIAVLGDYASVNVNNTREITDLGLEYALMTQYTSFVAVDSDPTLPNLCQVANKSNREDRVPDEIDQMTRFANSMLGPNADASSSSKPTRCLVGILFAVFALLR